MPEEQEINRNSDGTFPKGISGNPGGRPKGSVSIVSRIRQKFEENPEYFNEWVDKLLEDPSNRKAVMEQVDGKAAQAVDVTSGGKAITVQMISFDDNSNDTPQLPTHTD